MSRGTQVPATSLTTFAYGAITLYGQSFQTDSASGSVGNSPALNRAGPTTPMDPKTHRFGLFPRSLAATDEITDLFSLPSGTKMVHFPEFASESL